MVLVADSVSPFAAGSIRTPANFNGIYGLCPSTHRFPCYEAAQTSGQEGIVGVAGPLARSVQGLEIYTRTLLSLKPWEWDHTVNHMPWRQDMYEEGLGFKHPLCFGIMRHGVVRPHPPIERGIEETRQSLLKAGHNGMTATRGFQYEEIDTDREQ